ncbi:DUF2309 domain-containing protein [Nitrospira sp. Kam-Ns4a]
MAEWAEEAAGGPELLTAAERAHLRALVTQASEAVARNWPVRTIIARNPLEGYEHLPFDRAVRHGLELFGGRGYLTTDEYRTLYRQGRIAREDLLQALRDWSPLAEIPSPVGIGPHRFEPLEVAFLSLVHGVEAPAPAGPSLSGPSPGAAFETDLWEAALAQAARLSRDPTEPRPTRATPDPDELTCRSELLRGRAGVQLNELVNQQAMKWCRAFLDEGLAAWPMPNRQQGFFRAWRSLAAHDRSMVFHGVRTWPLLIQAIAAKPEDCIAWCLRNLKVPESAWLQYLLRHFVQLPGWAGFIRWRSLQPGYPMQRGCPIDPTDYVAVRLVYEVALVDALSGTEGASEGPRPTARETRVDPDEGGHLSRARLLFHLAQGLGISGPALRRASVEECQALLSVLDAVPPEQHEPIWQEAYEGTYRRALLAQVAQAARAVPRLSSPPARPTAQAVFCIDVRSEVFRRHLEAQGAYETLGFAGFFGVALRFRPFDQEGEQLLCPVLISPKHTGVEIPKPGQDERLRRYLGGSRWAGGLRHLVHALKAHPLASYLVVDLVGLVYGLGLLGKTLLRSVTRWLREMGGQWMLPPVATAIAVAPQAGQREAKAAGLSPSEQAAFVETALRLMGLTQRFAPLVVFCGHGSTSENNPLAAALDCGACGGNPGGPNARVLAGMANHPAVRRLLRERGIAIPDDTWFVAGRHDTTLDRVTLYDSEDVPESHRRALADLRVALERAGLAAARERCQRLPGGRRVSTLQEAARHVRRRSADWAQVRPEWGLSGNAACVIGRRGLTRGLNLEGRVFLHSYDPAQDEHGTYLEFLMTAPLLVMKMINLQYYFSAVDPWTYGSGSKVLHNVVGGVGVMLGRESDLQTGLALQSLTDGSARVHEPLRLLAIIEARTGVVEAIIGRHRELREMFDNQWARLVTVDPVTGESWLYRPGGRWMPCPVRSEAA